MRKNVRLIFSPQFEPFQPYLSLPYLKELLRLYNIKSSYIDCNIDFYHWLLKQKNELLSNDKIEDVYLLRNIKHAMSFIKTGTKYLSKYRWAISVTEEYLQKISTQDLSISLSNLEINNKYDSNTIKEFVFGDNNLLFYYFKDNLHKIIVESCGYYFFSLAVIEQLPASLIFAKEIKKQFQGTKIVFGGPFIKRLFNKLNSVEWIKEIVDRLESREGYLSIAGVFDIPILCNKHVSPDFSEIDKSLYLSPKPVFPYLISHGCKWGKCVFCAHHITYDSYRTSSIHNVIADLKYIRQHYGVEYISFSDEYLTKEQLDELCNELKTNRLDIKWSTFVRGEKCFSDETFVSKLYESGCRVLFFGFETFSQKLLDSMEKGTSATDYLTILETCKKFNIAVRIDLMFGFPGEKDNEAKEVFKIITKNRYLFDTPFSSIAIALFELKKDTPIFNNIQEFNINLLEQCRGNLDEVYNFSPHAEHSSEWREKLMLFFKLETDSELIAPNNKTHQLVLKNLYDEGEIKLMLMLTKENIGEVKFYTNSTVHFAKDETQYILSNLSNGCEIIISSKIGKLLEDTKYDAISFTNFSNILSNDINNMSILYELINFLYRNDFIILQKEKS